MEDASNYIIIKYEICICICIRVERWVQIETPGALNAYFCHSWTRCDEYEKYWMSLSEMQTNPNPKPDFSFEKFRTLNPNQILCKDIPIDGTLLGKIVIFTKSFYLKHERNYLINIKNVVLYGF